MTFPGGSPGGYPGQGPQQPPPGPGYGQQPPQGSPLVGLNLSLLLSLGVTLLGVVAYFLGFSDEANPAKGEIPLLLIGGLLAGLRAVPKGPNYLPVATVLSVVGALSLLDTVVGFREGADTPGIIVVLLIMGFLQMFVAVAALLFDLGVIKMPTPAPRPLPGQYGPPSGQFPQQPPPGQYGQPTQQYQPPPGQYGQGPSTPPGGYPQQPGPPQV